MVSRTLSPWALFVVISSISGAAVAREKSRSRCASGQRPSLSGCVDAGAPARIRARPEAQAKPVAQKPVPKPDPTLAVERAERRPLEIQKKHLLIRELVRLESVLRETPENSPDHPILLRRLAEGYAELEMLAERERAASQAAADDLERAAKEAEKTKKPKQRGSGTLL
jgi:hypothetical protein